MAVIGIALAAIFAAYLSVIMMIGVGYAIYYVTMELCPSVLPYIPFVVTAIIVRLVIGLIG